MFQLEPRQSMQESKGPFRPCASRVLHFWISCIWSMHARTWAWTEAFQTVGFGVFRLQVPESLYRLGER